MSLVQPGLYDAHSVEEGCITRGKRLAATHDCLLQRLLFGESLNSDAQDLVGNLRYLFPCFVPGTVLDRVVPDLFSDQNLLAAFLFPGVSYSQGQARVNFSRHVWDSLHEPRMASIL